MAASKNALRWTHVGPAPAKSVDVPPAASRIDEYVLAVDEQRQQLVYATSPDYHQFGHAWAWTGARWEQIASKTYRLGSAGHWAGGYDPVHGAVVGWTFDSEYPVGVVVGKKCTVIAEAEAFTDYSDDPFTRLEVTGEAPRPVRDANWDDVSGVFAIDPVRRVTVCLTPAAVFELSGKSWKKCVDVAEGLLPGHVNGEREGGAAIGVYDPARKAIVFALFDGDDDVLRLFTWDGTTLAALEATGLPERLSRLGENFAVGGHAREGLVLFAGGKLYTLGKKGFTSMDVADPPSKLQVGVLGSDPRGRTVLGPHKAAYTAQRAFLFFDGRKTERHGAMAVKSPLEGLSGYRLVHTGSSVLAVGTYLKTHEWTAAHGWEERLGSEAADKLRSDGSVQALVFAWGAPHVVFDDGRVSRWDKSAWKPVLATKPKDWSPRSRPAAAFDPVQHLIVLYGGGKGRHSESVVFDGQQWLDADGPKPKDDKKEAEFALAWDGEAKAVVRIGLTEVAWLRAKWEPAPRKDLKSFRGDLPHHARVLSDANGRVLCVQPWSGVVTELGKKARELGRFEAPQARSNTSHSDHFIDAVVIDEKNRLLAFLEDDVFASWALELPS